MSRPTVPKRLWLRWLGACVLLLCLLTVAAAALVFTEVGSGWLVAWCSPLLPDQVRFERFAGTLAGPFEVFGLEYSDASLSVRVEKLRVSWRPSQLLHHIVQLDSVRVPGALANLRHDSTETDSVKQKTEEVESDKPASSWQVKCGAAFVTGVVIEGPYGITVTDLEAQAAGQLDAYQVTLAAGLTIDTLSGLRLTCAASGDAAGLTCRELSITQDSSRLAVQGELKWKPELSWALTLEAERINPAAWIPHLEKLQGNLRFSASTTGRMTDTLPEFTVVVDTVSGLLRGTPLSAKAAVRSNGQQWVIDSSRIDWSGLTAQVQGVYGDTVQLTWDVNVPDLSVLNKEIAGQFEAKGAVAGLLDSIDVTAQFLGRDLVFGEYRAGRLEGLLQCADGGVGSSSLSFGARGIKTPVLDLDSMEVFAGGYRSSHFGSLTVAGPEGDARVDFDGRYDSVWHGDVGALTVNTAQYGHWRLSGPAEIMAGEHGYSLSELWLENGEQNLCLDGNFISASEWKLHAALVHFSLEQLAALWPESLQLAMSVNANFDLQAAEQSGVTASAKAALSPGWVHFGSATPDTLRTEAFTMGLEWTAQQGHVAIQGGWGAIDHPTRLVLDLNMPGTRRMMADLAGEPLKWQDLPWSGSLSMQSITLQGLEHFCPANVRLDGDASVEARASSSGGLIEGECRVELPPGRLLLVPEEDTLVLNWAASNLLLQADSTGLVAQASAALSTPEHSVGGLNVDLRSLSALDLRQNAFELPVEGSVRGQLDLAALQPFVTKLSGLQGHVDVSTTVSGTPRDLLLEGGLDLTAEAFVRDLGIQLSNIKFSMHGTGDSITVSGGMQSGEGSLAITGSLSRLPSRESPSRLHIQGENFLAYESREARVWISPELELVTTGDSLDVTGSIRVPKAQIEVAALPKQAVAASKDVVVVGDTLAAARSAVPFWAKVQLILGEQVFFKGFDLSTFLDGTIDTRVRPGSPIEGRGEVTLREGRYRGYGQDLQVDPGRFTFSGPIADPALDILAYRRANDNTKAGFKITGKLSALKIDLYSDPYRTDNDIMSYVLFGRAASENSESDRMRASEAAALVGGNLLAAQAASKIGLDEARIDPGTSTNDAALVAGMYLSPQLFVGYGTGLFETLHTLRVRYVVSKHISLQAETGTRETADVLYQIERGN